MGTGNSSSRLRQADAAWHAAVNRGVHAVLPEDLTVSITTFTSDDGTASLHLECALPSGVALFEPYDLTVYYEQIMQVYDAMVKRGMQLL